MQVHFLRNNAARTRIRPNLHLDGADSLFGQRRIEPAEVVQGERGTFQFEKELGMLRRIESVGCDARFRQYRVYVAKVERISLEPEPAGQVADVGSRRMIGLHDAAGPLDVDGDRSGVGVGRQHARDLCIQPAKLHDVLKAAGNLYDVIARLTGESPANGFLLLGRRKIGRRLPRRPHRNAAINECDVAEFDPIAPWRRRLRFFPAFRTEDADKIPVLSGGAVEDDFCVNEPEISQPNAP